MYINFVSPMNVVEAFNGAYELRYPVKTKKEGHVGSIYFVKDENGIGSVEWCKGNTVKGFGVKIALEELFSLLEAREAENEK